MGRMKTALLAAAAGLFCAATAWAGPGVSAPNPAPPRTGNPGAPPTQDDRAEIDRMRAAFERALNENRFDLLKPFVDPGFKGTSIAGTDMVGVDQLQAFMNAARYIMGQGATYHLKL